jgi:beta-lactamase class C
MTPHTKTPVIRLPHRFARMALVASALTGATSVRALDEAQLQATVEGAIRPLMARYDIPGMAVAVLVDGSPSVFNFGVMARPSNTAVTDSTRFEIGSVSKTFTALLAAYAQHSGKLSLNDHPGQHVRKLRGSAIDRATLLQLATYTAGGLPLQFPDTVGTDDTAALAWLRGWQPTHSPGAVRRYSNPSMGLLGLATARALGQDYAAAVETQLFPAFGMAHSHVRMPAHALPDYAWGHREGREVRMQPGPLADPAYGVRTTAADLLRFVQAQIDPQALPPPWRRAVEATQQGQFRAGPMVQGLGWDQSPWPVSREWLLGSNAMEMSQQPQPAQRVVDDAPGRPRLFGKTGATGGFAAYVAFVPSQRVGLVMLANRNHPIPARIEAAWSILQAIAPAD